MATNYYIQISSSYLSY